MSDECELSDYNVKPGSTVHMVLQLRGGAERRATRRWRAGEWACCDSVAGSSRRICFSAVA